MRTYRFINRCVPIVCMKGRHNLTIDDEVFARFQNQVGEGKVSQEVEQMMLKKLKIKRITKWVKEK